MNRRSTRYQIVVVRANGVAETIQASSRRVDAVKRAAFVANDKAGWPIRQSGRHLRARENNCALVQISVDMHHRAVHVTDTETEHTP